MAAVPASLVLHDAAVRRRSRASATLVAGGGLLACALFMAAPLFHRMPLHPLDQLIHVGVAASYFTAATAALLRRPGSRVGIWMGAVGFLWMVQDLFWIWQPLPYTIALAYRELYQPALATLALLYPSGRFDRRSDRLLMDVVWVWSLVSNPIQLLFLDPSKNGCVGCVQLLLVDPNQSLYHSLETVATYIGTVVIVVAAGFIVRHWRHATRASRRVMQPVLWVVPPALVFLLAEQYAGLFPVSVSVQHAIDNYLPAGLAVLPFGFLTGLLRTRLEFGRVGSRLPQLSHAVGPDLIRRALSDALRDPELQLYPWSSDAGAFVDPTGRPVGSTRPGRRLVELRGEVGPLAQIDVDDIVTDEPELLDSATAMARLVLENDRLQAEVQGRVDQLRSSAGRIVEAGQDARRRLERDLHDGAQQRLLALSITLGRARAHTDADASPDLARLLELAGADLQTAITELRELARGIHPALLTQQGLGPALRAVAERAALPVVVIAPDRRFPPLLESTTYFLVSEAISNAAHHSSATTVRVDVATDGRDLVIQVCDDGIGGATETGTGSGLRGIRDRVIALGGDLSVTSRPGAGTSIIARLPCE